MSCFISNSPEEWVDKICELYDDESTWQKFADNEKILVKQQYSFENGKKRFAEIFESVGIYTS
jgi:glycosyltransferase involved in cell wall biosynthesis